MPTLTGPIVHYPARAMIAWYVGLIALGTGVLQLPVSRVAGTQAVSWLDATFTATSATCVTGLTVRSTGNEFSLFGQIVILGLIQLGGIGIMTVTTLATFGWRRRQGLRERAVISETLGGKATDDLRWVLRRVIWLTVGFEAAGFAILFVRNLVDMPAGPAAWHALFHSVSAFCNAGFGLFDDSLTRYQQDPTVNLTIGLLIICGGLGFPVWFDLHTAAGRQRGERWHRLHLHTKFMLIGTASLIILGWMGILLLEWNHELADLSVRHKLLASWFHSVTTRTAGFNTLNVGQLTNATLFLTILLMTIGGGPCSTAGGFKVATLMTMLARAWATLRGRRQVHAFGRTVPERVIDRAVVTAAMFGVVSVTGLTLLLVLEQSRTPHAGSPGLFLDAAFEIVSALGTVGLSTGMTASLTPGGRIIVVLMMFLGRLGPVSVAIAISRSARPQPIELPEEEPLIG